MNSSITSLSVAVSPALKKACRVAAANENISLSDWVRAVLERELSFFANDVHYDAQNSVSKHTDNAN